MRVVPLSAQAHGMNTTAQIRRPRTPSGLTQPTDPRRSPRAHAAQRPTVREVVAEIVPLTGSVPFYGPAVALVLGPWGFLVLLLVGPFACLCALVVAIVAAATVLAALTAATLAILAAPRLLVGHVRRQRERHASANGRPAHVVAIHASRVAA